MQHKLITERKIFAFYNAALFDYYYSQLSEAAHLAAQFDNPIDLDAYVNSRNSLLSVINLYFGMNEYSKSGSLYVVRKSLVNRQPNISINLSKFLDNFVKSDFKFSEKVFLTFTKNKSVISPNLEMKLFSI